MVRRQARRLDVWLSHQSSMKGRVWPASGEAQREVAGGRARAGALYEPSEVVIDSSGEVASVEPLSMKGELQPYEV